MQRIMFVVLLAISFTAVSQVQYEPGYLINDQGQKQEVLILNKDWRSNPSEFTYKLSEAGEPETGNILDVKEFGVGDYLKFGRFKVSIDRSGESLRNISTKAEPEFSEETVFLKQLVAGDVNLYVYEEGVLERFFLSNEKIEITPLVHKKYLKESRMVTNNQFRQQLYNLASCGETTPEEFNKTEYTQKDLIAYLISYHDCRQAEYFIFKEEGKKLKVNFALKAGLDFSSLSVKKGMYVKGSEFDLKPSLRIGAEMEVVMPFNRNKWAVFVEPTYTRQKVEENGILSNELYNPHEVDLLIDYQFLSILTGARHYFYLNKESKIFLSGGATFDVPFKTHVYIDRDDRYELDPELNKTRLDAHFNLGIGFNYQKWSAEARYNSPRTVTGSSEVFSHYFLDWESETTSFSLLLGYRLF